MSDWLMRVINAEAERLIELAVEDDELRADLRALAESILAATTPPQPTINMTASISPSDAATEEENSTAAPRKELTLGRPSLSSSRSASVSTGR